MWDMLSGAIPNSTSLSAKRRTVHLALPDGGGEHAKATSLASKAPSNLMAFGLDDLGFLSRARGMPPSTNRLFKDSIVLSDMLSS
jgi:hypothetical protein